MEPRTGEIVLKQKLTNKIVRIQVNQEWCSIEPEWVYSFSGSLEVDEISYKTNRVNFSSLVSNRTDSTERYEDEDLDFELLTQSPWITFVKAIPYQNSYLQVLSYGSTTENRTENLVFRQVHSGNTFSVTLTQKFIEEGVYIFEVTPTVITSRCDSNSRVIDISSILDGQYVDYTIEEMPAWITLLEKNPDSLKISISAHHSS